MTGELNSGSGIVKDTVLECRLGIGAQVVAVVLAEYSAGAQVAKRQIGITDLCLEFTLLVIPHSNGGFSFAVKNDSDVSGKT